jgi:hypothetical protein
MKTLLYFLRFNLFILDRNNFVSFVVVVVVAGPIEVILVDMLVVRRSVDQKMCCFS